MDPSASVIADNELVTSESIDQLATALAKAQGKITKATRNKENSYFNSKYGDLEAVWDACRAQLSENGLAVIQAPHGNTLTTILTHASGQFIRSRLTMQAGKLDPQAVGSLITYARRYALASIVGVCTADEDDDGNAASGRTGNGQRHQQQNNRQRQQRNGTPRGQGQPQGGGRQQQPKEQGGKDRKFTPEELVAGAKKRISEAQSEDDLKQVNKRARAKLEAGEIEQEHFNQITALIAARAVELREPEAPPVTQDLE